MKQLLMIGSTVADVVVRVPYLPRTGEDLHVISQHTALGGCACNAYLAARRAGSAACTLFSPVGSGVWGDWIAKALAQRGITTPIPRVDAPSGCCYCLVEESGERTFLSHHGAEYLFQPAWFDAIDLRSYDGVYLCGLEVEERTGDVVLSALEAEPPRRLYFAPGPRICRIPPARMARIMALHPVLHLNAAEATAYTATDSVPQAAERLRQLSNNDVVITLGAEGAWVTDGTGHHPVNGVPAQVVDTIGAGDAHIGVIMAAEADNCSLVEAVALANHIAAAVVSVEGAELPEAQWDQLASLLSRHRHPIG